MAKYSENELQATFNLRDEIPKLQVELKEAEAKIPVLKKSIQDKTARLIDLIRNKGTSTGDFIKDHVVVKYGSINAEYEQILKNLHQSLNGKVDELFLVVFADAGQEFFLGQISSQSLMFTEDCSVLAFPLNTFAHWKSGKVVEVVNKGSLSAHIHQDFEWSIPDLSKTLKDNKTPQIRILVGDGEVWKFFKNELNSSKKNQFREAFKALKITDDFSW